MKKLLIILLTLMLTVPAFAEGTYTRYRLPLGTRLEVSGIRYMAYDLSGMRTLLKMDADLKYAEAQIPLLNQKLTLLSEENTKLQNVVSLNDKQLSLCSAEVARKDLLVTKLTKDNVTLLDKLTRRKRAFRIGFSLAGVAIAGLVTGIWIAK